MPNFMKGLFVGANKKAVNIQRACYAMSSENGREAEITLYGVIVNERPRDWQTGEPDNGSYIVLGEFLEDFRAVEGAEKLCIHLHSTGGDVYATLPIYNRIAEFKGEVTAIIEGVAMSGGSLIACAAKTVKALPGTLYMIHKCWLFLLGGYNADELRRITESNDAVDRVQASIYSRKTGLGEEEILSMMEKETYMTGAEAAEKGFVDELLDGKAPEIAASADCRTLYVNGRAIQSAFPHVNLPDSIPTVEAAEKADAINTTQPAQTGGNKGGKTMAKTLDELKKENPDLANELMAQAQAAASAEIEASGDAVGAERKRIKEIDEISALYSEEMVQEAKYGEKPCTAQELAFRAAKEAAKQGQKVVSGMEDDTKASGVQKVTALPGADDGAIDGNAEKTPDQRLAEAKADVQALFGKRKEG